MKVLHVIPAVSPEYGGPSQALAPMCEALQSQGVEVKIASTDASPRGHLELELEKVTDFKGIPAIFFTRAASESFKYSPKLARWLNDHVPDFDVVHIHGFFSHACRSAASACSALKVPYVIRPLGNLEQRSLSRKAFKKNLFLKLGGYKLLKNAAALHYVCDREKELSEAALGLNHGVVIPLGIKLPDRSTNGANSRRSVDPPYVLVLSRLHRDKGIDVLLKAFLSLQKDNLFTHWRLVIAGDGKPDYSSELKRIVGDARANDSVDLTGWLEGKQKETTLARASLLALPSRREAFGICLLEAFSHGIPVLVGSDVGLANEIQSAGAGWVSAVNIHSLRDSLKQALSEHDERQRRGNAARELARKFDPVVMATMLSRLYHKICAQG